MDEQTAAIRLANDRFRKGDAEIPGRRVITQGVQTLLGEHRVDPIAILSVVQDFDDFTMDNDPYQQHDFGAFDFKGERCFWKIDLYDSDYQYGTEAPLDLRKTARVLTILLASEY